MSFCLELLISEINFELSKGIKKKKKPKTLKQSVFLSARPFQVPRGPEDICIHTHESSGLWWDGTNEQLG